VRLVALVESSDHVCCRYRLAAFRPYLAAAGHVLEVVSLPQSWLSRLRLFRRLRSADVVILQRKLLPPLQLAALRRCAHRLVFDFDDAIWLRDSYHPRGLYSAKRADRFRRTIIATDLVIAGNRFLAEAAMRVAPTKQVAVIPTCVDPTTYPVAAPVTQEGLRIVWVGSASTLQGLVRIREYLAAVGHAVPGTRLKLICDQFLDFNGMAVERVRWDASTEAREIADADVGIAWMPEDDWSRGKCGLKVLQYQAAGLPVIANPVGVHREMIRSGETGLLASTATEWATAAAHLAGDVALRWRMGVAGRAQVEAHYSVTVGGRAWVECLAKFVKDSVAGSQLAG
jgi:glycosyltransferase involved in cell wall biosynthesis